MPTYMQVSLSMPAAPGAPPTEYAVSMQVVGGVTMEVTIAQWWASIDQTEASLTVEYFGLVPSTETLLLDGRALFSELTITAPFRSMPVEPQGELSTLQRAVRPLALTLTLTHTLTLTLTPITTSTPTPT